MARFTSLAQAAAQAESRIDKVKRMLGDANQPQEALKNLRERLAGLEPEVNATSTRIEKASGVLERAEPAIWNIAKSEETSKWMGERLNTVQAAVNELQSGIATVSAIIEPAQKSMGAITWVEAPVNTARNRLDQLQPEIETLADRVEKASQILEATPSPRRREAALSVDEGKLIPQELAARGHEPGLIDGRPGEKTRRAIRSYQHLIGNQLSGQLPSEQIARLLKRPADRKETAVFGPQTGQ